MAYTNCENTIDPGEVLCGDTHCNNYAQTSTMKRVCYCLKPDGTKLPPDQCQPKGDSFPVSTTECYNKATGQRLNITPEACDQKRDQDKNWGNRTCYCCCSCFAWGTLIAVPGEEREVQTIGVGEPILAGSVTVMGGAVQVSWAPRTVAYSDGTSPAPEQTVVLIQYGDDGELIVTTDQPFVTPEGELVRADRLTVEDRLVDAQGNPVAIAAVVLGKREVGLHHLATDVASDSGLDGHILLANGVLAGDHTVRLLQNSVFAEAFASGHDERPVLGTEEYAQALESGRSHRFASVAGEHTRTVRHRGFVSMADVVQTPPPRGAVSFLTGQDARAIRENGEFAPPTVQVNVAEFRYLQRLIAGFFPAVHFHLDWESEDPNAWAFEAYGVRVVQVSGKLLRARCIRRDGLAFIMAQGLARFYGAPPADAKGLACTGQADYYAMGVLFIELFYGRSAETGLNALSQVKTLFSWAGDPGVSHGGRDRCRNPGLACRLEAMNAALAGFDLPRCAGGPLPGSLRLESAEVRRVDELPAVVATFSDPVDPHSVGNVVSWSIRPVSEVTAAQVDPDDPHAVVLRVVFPEPPEGSYTLSVTSVVSHDGSTLDPDRSSADFEVSS